MRHTRSRASRCRPTLLERPYVSNLIFGMKAEYLQSVPLTCSPGTDPATMRVRRPGMGKRRILDEEETHPRADRAQAARGRGRDGRWGLKPRGRKKARHQR